MSHCPFIEGSKNIYMENQSSDFAPPLRPYLTEVPTELPSQVLQTCMQGLHVIDAVSRPVTTVCVEGPIFPHGCVF